MDNDSKQETPEGIWDMFEGLDPAEEVNARLQENRVDYAREPEFVAAYLKAKLVEDIVAAMECQGMNKQALAKQLDRSRQYVSRVLNETANFTIDSIARIACALDAEVEMRIQARRAASEMPSVDSAELWRKAAEGIRLHSRKEHSAALSAWLRSPESNRSSALVLAEDREEHNEAAVAA